MDMKQKLIGLLGSAVILGLGVEGSTPAHAGEGKYAGMEKGAEQTKEATHTGMKKDEKQKSKKKTKENEMKKDEKEKSKEKTGGEESPPQGEPR